MLNLQVFLVLLFALSASFCSADAIAQSLEIQSGKRHYTLVTPAAPERAAYDSMGEPEKAAFHTNRKIFLTTLARGLRMIKYGLGVGVIGKDSIRYQIQAYRLRSLTNDLATVSRGLREDIMAAQESALDELEDGRRQNEGLAFRERSERVIQRLLEAADLNLWTQAPLFSRSNEFGVVFALGVELLGGHKEKGWGGLIDLGISVGYNRDERAMVIQIFRDMEHFKSTSLPAVFLAGIMTKAGIYIANQSPGTLQHDGVSYYPPMAPAFSSITRDNFMAGLSSGLTWPPSPIGDMLTYSDQLNQNMVLRVTASRLLPQFFHLESGLTAKSLNAVMSPIKKAIAFFKTKIWRRSCEGSLSRSKTDASEGETDEFH